jgi:hypothetical protein
MISPIKSSEIFCSGTVDDCPNILIYINIKQIDTIVLLNMPLRIFIIIRLKDKLFITLFPFPGCNIKEVFGNIHERD